MVDETFINMALKCSRIIQGNPVPYLRVFLLADIVEDSVDQLEHVRVQFSG